MLTIPGRPVRTCEGWSRRELLRVGGAGLCRAALCRTPAAGSLCPSGLRSRALWSAGMDAGVVHLLRPALSQLQLPYRLFHRL